MDAFGAAFEATGLVVACVAGGHILLATAGVAGFGLNAAQQYMTDSLGKLKKNPMEGTGVTPGVTGVR